MNFDVLIADPEKGIAVLVEIERTLLDRLPGKISKFGGKVDVVRSNTADFDVEDYFADGLPDISDTYDFVLASQFLNADEIRDAARTVDDFDLDFMAWLLASHGNQCRVKYFIIK